MIKIKIVSRDAVLEWVSALHRERPGVAMAMLLAGDRWLCVRDVCVVEEEGQILGIATIAPEGEERSGEPTIVALYVLRENRERGIGYQLLEAAVDYMIAEKLVPIRVDAINSKILKMVERLPEDKRRLVQVFDQSAGGLFDIMLDQ